MQELLDFIVALSLVMLVAAGLVLASLWLWVRAQRRRARRRVEQTLDRLAEQVARRLAVGDAPGWALSRYARLTDDARSAHTWGALQRLVLRERLFDEARTAFLRAPGRLESFRRRRPAAPRTRSANR